MTLGRKYQQGLGNAGDGRRTFGYQTKVGTLSSCSSSISLSDMIEPPDYEEICESVMGDGDPLAYPTNDIDVLTVPRRIRTVSHVLPDEDLSKAPLFVRDCISSYTSDYTVVEYKYRGYSGSMNNRERMAERLEKLQSSPAHQYEIDLIEEQLVTESQSQPSSGRQSVASACSSSSGEVGSSGASGPDLRSSSADPLLPGLLDDQRGEQTLVRSAHQPSDLLGLYSPYLEEEEPVERRLPAEMPCEIQGHRILVHCHQLKLELDVEPLFASMALYDCKERRKLSENFYFNLNSETTKQMLADHIPHADISTMSRSAVFDILNPSPDIFLVIRIEKVLQGDVNECIEPYVKDDKNREKVRASAEAACSRLGKYRMALCWSAVSLLNVLSGASSLEREPDHPSLGSNTNSLDRKASSSSLEQLRRRAGEVGGSLTRKGSIERRPAASSDELASQLDGFKPIHITLTSFFKQETDKLRDEDLYKFLAEIKRPSSAPKKLKCIPGTLKIEVSPCPEEIKNGLTPELAKLQPYGDEEVRPCKEILPFPQHAAVVPHMQYRNLLYLFIKEINFSAYTSKTVSARNITVKIQLMSGEDQSSALPVIFGRSSCPEFETEAYTCVLYHNKNPSLYDEVKLRLPASLGDSHHLLFTFLHVSCQRKPDAPGTEKHVDTVLGYSWLPLCRNGKLTCGDFSLPVMLEEPPPNYSFIFPDVLLPGTKWVDNHKPIFFITLDAHTTVHPLDNCIERFATACEAVQEGNIPPRIGLANMEAELRASIAELPSANEETLARYFPVICNKLLVWLVAPPSLMHQPLNIAQDVFHCLSRIFLTITNMSEGKWTDGHGRSQIVSTYIQFQCRAPRPVLSDTDIGLPLPPHVIRDGSCKVLHEELALQWVVSSGSTREYAMQNSWALFELMVKSMIEYLVWSGAEEAPRKARFPEQYTDDVSALVNCVTTEIISRYGKDSKLTQSLNNSLAFFLMELLSIMDRGYVLTLIRSYHKQMCAKIASLPGAVPLVHYKLSFLRIVCSHEHYIPLCLPSPLSPPSAGAASGPPSARGSASQSSAAPHQLSHQFRSMHYLCGLLLADLTAALHLQSPVLQCAGVTAVLALLSAHDGDPRLSARVLRQRAASLYLPLIDIALDHHAHLHTPFSAKETLPLDNEMGQFTSFCAPVVPEEYNQNNRPMFNSETSRNLLMCLVWVLKNAEPNTLSACIQEMPPNRTYALLDLIQLCFGYMEYKGRKELLKCAQQNVRSTTDIKNKLEDVILGQGSARSDMIMRRKGGGAGRGARWRKEWARGGGSSAGGASPPPLAALLSAHVADTLLHAIDVVVQSCSVLEQGGGVCAAALQCVLRAMQRNQSALVLQHMFASVRALVQRLGWQCDDGSENGGSLANTCLVVVRHMASTVSNTRAHAAAALYLLMRHHYSQGNNFSRVKMQVTMALSSLVGTTATLSEDSLRRALKTVLVYAEQDQHMHDTNFPEQVKDLVFNLHMILSDTVKMKEFQQDPEMLLELMHRIAKGYRHSPDLRLTWLNNMANNHMERANHSEAGMCFVHGAALVAEQLGVGGGAVSLQRASANALDEATNDTHHHLSAATLQALLEHAASELMLGGMYETVNEVYKVLLPIAEQNRDYKKLANIHSKLNEAFSRIEQLHGKRVFGTYFRVSFFGARFGDLSQQQFVYKEHALTKLPEIFTRLENFYSQRFGAENVVIIKDSNTVDVSSLDPDKAYIQITYVEPYFEAYELRRRVTHFERNFNIKRFMFCTPFTLDGRSHGEIFEQYKRKTILTTEHHFPYVKSRVRVTAHSQIVLAPIELAIEDIQKKTAELAAATSAEPSDSKMLQMVLQGCIGTTVNQGPLELAQVFLVPVAEGTAPATKLTNKLRLAFKDFAKKSEDALRKNRVLIGCSQREYQRELERNLSNLKERLGPLLRDRRPLQPSPALAHSNGMCKDYKFQA